VGVAVMAVVGVAVMAVVGGAVMAVVGVAVMVVVGVAGEIMEKEWDRGRVISMGGLSSPVKLMN
jgi:hypothetical protein